MTIDMKSACLHVKGKHFEHIVASIGLLSQKLEPLNFPHRH